MAFGCDRLQRGANLRILQLFVDQCDRSLYTLYLFLRGLLLLPGLIPAFLGYGILAQQLVVTLKISSSDFASGQRGIQQFLLFLQLLRELAGIQREQQIVFPDRLPLGEMNLFDPGTQLRSYLDVFRRFQRSDTVNRLTKVGRIHLRHFHACDAVRLLPTVRIRRRARLTSRHTNDRNKQPESACQKTMVSSSSLVAARVFAMAEPARTDAAPR